MIRRSMVPQPPTPGRQPRRHALPPPTPVSATREARLRELGLPAGAGAYLSRQGEAWLLGLSSGRRPSPEEVAQAKRDWEAATWWAASPERARVEEARAAYRAEAAAWAARGEVDPRALRRIRYEVTAGIVTRVTEVGRIVRTFWEGEETTRAGDEVRWTIVSEEVVVQRLPAWEALEKAWAAADAARAARGLPPVRS